MFGAYLSWAFFNPPVIPIFLFVEKRFPSQYKLEIVGTNLRYPAVKVVVNGYGTKLFFVKSGFGSQKSAANLYTPWPPMCSWKKGTRTENYISDLGDFATITQIDLQICVWIVFWNCARVASCQLQVLGLHSCKRSTNFKNRCACLCLHEI